MFCENCGKEMIGSPRFCPYCGGEQTATVTPAASVTSVPLLDVTISNTASVPAEASSEPSVPVSAVETKSVGVPLDETVEIKDEEKPSPKLRYSLKHLVMCLVAAGVMAIAAGVFAGMYFSLYFS